MKNKVNDVVVNTKNVWANAQEFVNAVCLGAVSAYSFTQSLDKIQDHWYKALLFASVLIGLQALVLFVRHFNRPVSK